MRRRFGLLAPVLLVLLACSASSGLPSARPTDAPRTNPPTIAPRIKPSPDATAVAASASHPARTLELLQGDPSFGIWVGTYALVAVGPLPAGFPPDLVPPAATAAVVASYENDAETTFAVFADTTPAADLIRYYAGIIVAHRGSIDSADTGTDGVSMIAYAPDLTIILNAAEDRVSIMMDPPPNGEPVLTQAAYPATLPKALLPDDRLSMDLGGNDASLRIFTLVPATTLVANVKATLKTLAAKDVTVESDETGVLYRGRINDLIQETWIQYDGIVSMVQISAHEPPP